MQILFLTLALEKLFLVLLLWGVTRRNFKLFPADLIFSTTSACELHFISLKNHEIISKIVIKRDKAPKKIFATNKQESNNCLKILYSFHGIANKKTKYTTKKINLKKIRK